MEKSKIINCFNSKLNGGDFVIDNDIIELSLEYLTDLGYTNPEKFIEYIIHEHPQLMINLYKKYIKYFCVKYNINMLNNNNQILLYVSD